MKARLAMSPACCCSSHSRLSWRSRPRRRSPKSAPMTKRVVALITLLAATVSGQTPTRRATNLAALIAHPTFYHLRPITVVGEVKLQDNGERRVTTDGVSMKLVVNGDAPDGVDEIRGEYIDVG